MGRTTVIVFIGVCLVTFGAIQAKGETEIVTAVIPPYAYLENNVPKGVVVEIVQEMAKIVGHSGKITFLPWKRALQMAEKADSKEPKLIIPLNRSPERENIFKWVQEIVVDDTVLVGLEENREVTTDLEKAKARPVGVLLGSPLEAQLKKLGFTRIEPAVDEETNARKLQIGRIDLWFVARLVAPFVYERHAFDTSVLSYGLKLDANDLYLGASPGFDDKEAKVWQDAYANLKANGVLTKILAKYRVIPADNDLKVLK